MFCEKCGGKLESYAKNCAFCGHPTKEQFGVSYVGSNNAKEHTSILKWLLVALLMFIPIVNFILLFVWAFGDNSKNDLTFRNWAKAQLLAILISLILWTIIVVVFSSFFLDLAGSLPQI